MCGPRPCSSPTCTWAESHRALCEAMTVMCWQKERRTAYYGMVRAKRGDAAAAALVSDVNRERRASGG